MILAFDNEIKHFWSTDDGIDICVSEEHSEKAQSEILITGERIFTCFND